MIIQLSEIMNVPGNEKILTVPIEMENFILADAVYPFVQKDSVMLRIVNRGNRKVLIEAKTDVSVAASCDRCLKDVIIPIHIEVEKEIDFSKTEQQRTEDLDETNYVSGYDLDVDKLIYDEVLIGFPMKVLCNEDCKGLCKVCGANLNEGECGCDRAELDPRMSAIRDIFNNFKEV